MDVEFSDVSAGYGEHTILEGISFRLEGPGLVCIIGPNGVGKSTLVRCINKLLKPSKGTVTVNGHDVTTLTNREVAEHVAYVPASAADVFSMPVIDTILVGRHSKQGFKTTKADLEAVHRVMELLGISDLAMRGYNELSAGQHQRVTLARGIVQDTEIMILDEPTANLDVRNQMYVTQLLRALADESGKLIIMICHDLNIAAKYASQIIVLEPPGRICTIGKAEDVITSDVIRRVYDVDCEVIEYEGRPYVMIKSELP